MIQGCGGAKPVNPSAETPAEVQARQDADDAAAKAEEAERAAREAAAAAVAAEAEAARKAAAAAAVAAAAAAEKQAREEAEAAERKRLAEEAARRNPVVFLDVAINGQPAGRICVEVRLFSAILVHDYVMHGVRVTAYCLARCSQLFRDKVPKTAENFRCAAWPDLRARARLRCRVEFCRGYR
jgi:hypothetical protein